MRELDLSRFEGRASQSTFEDGLWDGFIGYLLIQLAVIPLTGDLGLGIFWGSLVWLPLYALVYGGIRKLKAEVTAPRLGHVRLRRSGNSRPGGFRLLMTVLLIVNATGGVVVFRGRQSGWVFPVLLAVFMAGAFALAGRLLGVRRLKAYGLAASASVLAGEGLSRALGLPHHGLPPALGTCGGLVAVMGAVRFFIFLRRYPRPHSARPG